MNADDFEKVFERQVGQSREVLVEKARQYANDDDRLHNFNKTAAFEGCTPELVAWHFNMKHLASISDMVAKGTYFPPEVWDEKIGDAINYLILLRAIVFDTEDERAVAAESTLPERLPEIHFTQHIHPPNTQYMQQPDADVPGPTD